MIEEFTKIKNAACLVMASNIPIVVRTQNISLETRSYLANALINTIFLENVSLPLKLTLQTVIKALYNADTSKIHFKIRVEDRRCLAKKPRTTHSEGETLIRKHE